MAGSRQKKAAAAPAQPLPDPLWHADPAMSGLFRAAAAAPGPQAGTPDAKGQTYITPDALTVTGNVLTDDIFFDVPLTIVAVNGSSLAVGQLITLPSGALLRLDADGSLTYQPNGAFDALPTKNDSFTYTVAGGDTATVTVTVHDSPGTSAAGTLTGTAGNDNILGGNGFTTFGLAGNDILSGGGILIGGPGNDRYSDPATIIELEGEGYDTIFVSGSFTSSGFFTLAAGVYVEELVATSGVVSVIHGNETDNVLRAHFWGRDELYGHGGNDTFIGFQNLPRRQAGEVPIGGPNPSPGFDTMIGGPGDDIYFLGTGAVIELPGEGYDIVYIYTSGSQYSLSGSIELLALVPGFQSPIGVVFTGSDSDNEIRGGAGGDRLLGESGNDILNGLGGADTTDGGPGNDIHHVDNMGDVVIERGGGGRDTVYAGVSYVLDAAAEVEVLAAATPGATDAIALTGNGFAQEIRGNAGANILIGGGGADILAGQRGDDIYLISSGSEILVEDANGGRDVVYSALNYSLTAGAHIEVLSASGLGETIALHLGGNELAQAIYGNAGANGLYSHGGADYLAGFGGDDTYFVAGGGEHVAEAAGQGRDVVYASASYALAAGSHVEALSADWILGTDAINLTGNEFNNEVYGNNGANMLNGGGGGGGDYLVGWGGDDTYLVFGGGEIVVESAGGGRDVVYSTVSYLLAAGTSVEVLSTSSIVGTNAIDLTGNELAQEVYGNNGANTLNGGAGGDYLVGFGGADSFAFTTALGSGNVDFLADFNAADDVILLENAVFTGLAGGALPASAFGTGPAGRNNEDLIFYDRATGQIFFDADGNGAGAQVLFATVNAGTVLTASDFMVI
jgi:Ca2+-binding RTX toxin-like protein